MSEITILLISAASIGFIHTLLGPDHYLPFIVMSKARNWSVLRTTLITVIAGVGHVLSSVVLGFLGIGFGIAVNKLEFFESIRGQVASWMLISFGLAYLIWGIRKAIKGHTHIHLDSNKKDITPWVIFTIFIFGPCEPLIPLLMYPAAKKSIVGCILVTSVFGLVTLSTMLAMVLISIYGTNKLKSNKLHKYTHALAGGTILASGLAIQFLGL